MKRAPRSGEAGITLIELLLVMIVVSILATIAYPSMDHARERSRRSALMANVTTMEKELYDYNLARGYLPPTNHLEYLVIDGFLPEIPNDPFTADLPRESGPLGAWNVEDRVDYRYVNDTASGVALLWPESRPELLVTIDYRR